MTNVPESPGRNVVARDREGPSPPRRRIAVRVAGLALAIACIVLFAREAALRWNDIRAIEWRWGWQTTAAVACIVLGHIAAARLTHDCLRMFGGAPHWPHVLRVHLLSQAAKYLPVGGVLNVAAQTAGLARLSGVGPRRGALGVVCMTAIVCAGGVSWFGLALLVPDNDRATLPGAFTGMGWAFLLALPAVILVVAQSWFWRRLAARLTSAAPNDAPGAPPLSGSPDADAGGVVPRSRGALVGSIALMGTATMGLFGASLAFLAAQVTTVELLTGVRLVGCMSAAWVLGFLSFLVPAGMGVRDYSLMVLMRAIVPEPWPVVIPAVSRLVWLATEIACFLAAASTLPRRNSRASRARPSDPSVQR